MSQGRPDQFGPRPAGTLDQHGEPQAAGPVTAAGHRTDPAADLTGSAAGPDGSAEPAPGGLTPAAGPAGRFRAAVAHPVVRHLALLAVYLAAGITVTWPRAAYITGFLPESRDVASYVWDLQWVAHQIVHLGNPWFTTQMAAPAGIQLGFDTTMPLAGLIMTPITLAFGPSAAFTLLTIAAPGLACYTTYRAARLWLATPGAIAAGALLGLSAMLDWQAWYHLNIALGTVFLPLTLEAAIALRRRPRPATALALGLILGASLLVNQESAVLATALAAILLLAWLIHPAPSQPNPHKADPHKADLDETDLDEADPDKADPDEPNTDEPNTDEPNTDEPNTDEAAPRARTRLVIAAIAAAAALIIASPQLIAMAQQLAAGGASAPAALLAHTGKSYAVGLPGMFAPTARVANFGLHGLATASAPTSGRTGEGMPMFGLLLSVLALLGLAVSWRRLPAWLLAGLWLGCAALALGPSLYIGKRQYVPLPEHWLGQRVSWLMPYTWVMHTPGLSALREADRFALLGLVGAAILAGAAVDWLNKHAWPVIIVVAALAVIEAGWQGGPRDRVMPTTLAKVDRPIAADHSGSIVVDVPYGLRGGIPQYGSQFSAKALLIATADGHPRAISYTSWVPAHTIAAISGHAFYAQLNRSEHGIPMAPAANHNKQQVSAAQLTAARQDARRLHLGWAVVWGGGPSQHPYAIKYLLATGFRFAYQADGVWVYRYTG